MKANVYRWADLPEDHPIPLLDRRRLVGTHLMAAQVLLHKGCHVPTHQHENEQIAFVQSGRVRFGIGSEGSSERYDVVLSAGEFIQFEPNVPHSADAEEDTLIWDFFSPVGEGMGIDKMGAPGGG